MPADAERFVPARGQMCGTIRRDTHHNTETKANETADVDTENSESEIRAGLEAPVFDAATGVCRA